MSKILLGDCRSILPTLDAGSVRCCCTSPPYWGLRDYGTATWEGGSEECDHMAPPRGGRSPETAGKQLTNAETLTYQFAGICHKCGARRIDAQIGLEPTPEEYVAQLVAVFREVRRVLTDDGTLWLNLGDSYTSGGRKERDPGQSKIHPAFEGDNFADGLRPDTPNGLKPKDLVGIPWRVAFALQQPYYTGTIRNELDRVWLAAMIEAEGCLFIHKRKEGQSNGQGYERKADSFGAGLEVANTSLAIVERCQKITGLGSICSQSPEQNGRRKQTLYRWNLRSNVCRDVVREVYPYLVGKQQQARILIGCPSSGNEALAAHAALKGLHQGFQTGIDFPAPRPMYEPGFYLRSDVIWSKLNPMPESVTDRPTKSHEYVFLLSKSARYYYDAGAISEPALEPDGFEYAGNYRETLHLVEEAKRVNVGSARLPNGTVPHYKAGHGLNRNARSVWTIPTQPMPDAHFATFPEALAERCILAGSAEGDTVLDPFFGSGTVGKVAERLGRKWLGIELNPDYVEIARRKTAQRGIFGEAAIEGGE